MVKKHFFDKQIRNPDIKPDVDDGRHAEGDDLVVPEQIEAIASQADHQRDDRRERMPPCREEVDQQLEKNGKTKEASNVKLPSASERGNGDILFGPCLSNIRGYIFRI